MWPVLHDKVLIWPHYISLYIDHPVHIAKVHLEYDGEVHRIDLQCWNSRGVSINNEFIVIYGKPTRGHDIIEIWNRRPLNRRHTISCGNFWFWDVFENQIEMAYSDGRVRIWNMHDGECIHDFVCHWVPDESIHHHDDLEFRRTSFCRSVKFTETMLVIMGNWKHELKAWDKPSTQRSYKCLKKLEEIDTCCAYDDIIYCAQKVGPGGSVIQMWMRVYDTLVLLQELSTDGYIGRLFRHGATLGSLISDYEHVYHKDFIRLWDVGTREQVKDIAVPDKKVSRVCLLPTGIVITRIPKEALLLGWCNVKMFKIER